MIIKATFEDSAGNQRISYSDRDLWCWEGMRIFPEDNYLKVITLKDPFGAGTKNEYLAAGQSKPRYTGTLGFLHELGIFRGDKILITAVRNRDVPPEILEQFEARKSKKQA